MVTGSLLAKLRAMSLHEIATRLRYRGAVARERQLHRSGRLAPHDRLRRALDKRSGTGAHWQEALLERARAGKFFTGVAAPTVDRFRAHYGDELQKARRIADAAARHEIDFFGERFSFGERIDWHLDPVSKAEWPRVFHGDVPIHGDRRFGDVKYVWELNRHQFLIDLAKVALVDGSQQHRRALQAIVEDWLREVPYATGVPWACALEPAFRSWSWLWAYHMLRASGPLDPDFHLAWLTGFYDHGRFLHRHLETYSSPYNHLVGEASALFALGLLFPEFEEAPAWVARGRQVLESTLPSQFYADGGTVEQSTFYHHATLGFYLLAACLGRINRADLSGTAWQAISRALEFSMALSQPDGRVPRIGGADDGKPIRLEHLPFFDFRPYQAIGAVLFSRADFKYFAGRFWEDALWLLGSDAADEFARMDAHAPATAVALPDSGYWVARSSWSDNSDYLCFDCGPQAGGLRSDDVPSAAHGHADCLTVVAVLGGREVLVDPGFLCYNGDPAWEVHFRKTRAHNTIVVDGADQARHSHKMVWTHTYAASLSGWSPAGDIAWARGSHDGYSRAALPVVHQRTAWLRPGYIVLYDELVGAGTHEFEAVFQLAPGRLVAEADGTALFDGRFGLAWGASVALCASISSGGEEPSAGWIAPSLGVREPAPRLALRGTMPGDRVALLTLVTDRTRQVPGMRCDVSLDAGAGLLRARVYGDGWTDDVLASLAGHVTADGIETDAPVVVLRSRGAAVEQVFQAGGSRIVISAATKKVPDTLHEGAEAVRR